MFRTSIPYAKVSIQPCFCGSVTKHTCGAGQTVSRVSPYIFESFLDTRTSKPQILLEPWSSDSWRRQMMGEDLYDLSLEVPLHSTLVGYDGIRWDHLRRSIRMKCQRRLMAGSYRTPMPKWTLIQHERQMVYFVFHPFKQLYLCVTYKQLLVRGHSWMILRLPHPFYHDLVGETSPTSHCIFTCVLRKVLSSWTVFGMFQTGFPRCM